MELNTRRGKRREDEAGVGNVSREYYGSGSDDLVSKANRSSYCSALFCSAYSEDVTLKNAAV